MESQSNPILAQLSQSPTEANLQALRAHCQQSGDRATLVRGLVTFAHAQATQDPALSAESLVEAAAIQLQSLHDPRGARPLYERALELWPTLRPALDGLRGALHQLGEYEALALALERYAQALAEVEGDPVELGALHLELGHMHRDRFERLDRAVAHYRTAVDFDAAQREALRAARDIYRQAGKWDSVAKLLALEAESFPEGQKKAVLLAELAALQRDQLGHLEAAQHTFEEAARCLPEDLGVKHQLALLHLEQADRAKGTPEAAAHNAAGADILTTMAEAVDDEYALPYTRAALDAAPSHARAMAVYERVATRAGHAAEIVERWQRSLSETASGGEARRVRLALGRHLLEHGQDDEARGYLDPLLRAGDADARALLDAQEQPSPDEDAQEQPSPDETGELLALDEDALEPLDESALQDEAVPDADDEDADGDALEDEATAARAPAQSAEDEPDEELTAELSMSDSDAAQALSASLEEALSETDLEEMTGERTPVSMVPSSELARLHEELNEKLRAQDQAAAVALAERVLELAPVDPTALITLEEHYRSEREFEKLRDLVLHLSRQAELPLDARIQRLREAAFLSEQKLEDVNATAAALGGILALVPSDEVALGKLRSLYEKHERHDELAQLLERQAATLTDLDAQVDAYRELFALHRDRRGQLEDALDALRYLRDLQPEQAEHEDALADLLVELGRSAEAVPLLEARLVRTEDPEARAALQLSLADIYERELDELGKAHELASAALHQRPDDDALLDRLLRLDETLERHDWLVEHLKLGLPRLEGDALATTHARIAALAGEKLGDVELACTHYGEALRLRPQDEALWEAAGGSFESCGRDEELHALLQQQAESAESDALASMLWRRLSARRAAEGNLSAAIDAMHQLAGRTPDDLEVQSELVDLLEQHGARPEDLLEQLARLAERTPDAGHRRELRMRRVEILRDELVEPRRARDELRALVDEDESDEDALRLLSELCADLQDDEGLASALLRRLGLGRVEAQLAVAEQLAALAEQKLQAPELALTALRTWHELTPDDPAPLARMLPYLKGEALADEKLRALDTLARLSADPDEAVERILEAASVAEAELGDDDGAWRRLAHATVELGHRAAEEPLRELAERAGRGEALAELFVSLAQKAEDAREKLRRWMDAAEAYEKLAGNDEKALEATLRGLALDLENLALLDEADRLAGAAGAWARLSKVYDSLSRKAESSEARVRLLTRHATLLEEQAGDPGHALDRLIAACALTPADDALLQRALRLADRTDRDTDVLPVYERRAELAERGSERARALLDACSLAHRKLEDSARSKGYLQRALRVSLDSDTMLDELETATAELDALDPPIEGQGLVDALAAAYTESVETQLPTPERAARLLQRAAKLSSDAAEATRTLMKAFEYTPSNEALLDELARAAERASMESELVALLRKVADDSIDSETASLVLRRLGGVLMDSQSLPSEAADVFKQLVLLRPADLAGRARLRECLREAERHQELLVAIDQQLSRTDDPALRMELLREAARCWHHDLSSRSAARDAWQRLLGEAPEDAEALTALEELSPRKRDEDEDAELLESGLVVMPEDLTHVAPEPSAAEGPNALTDTAAATAAEPDPDETQPATPAHDEQTAPAAAEQAPEEAAANADADVPTLQPEARPADAEEERTSSPLDAAAPDTEETPLTEVDDETPFEAEPDETAEQPISHETTEVARAADEGDAQPRDGEEQVLDADALVEELEPEPLSGSFAHPATGVHPTSQSRPPSMPPPPPPSAPPPPAEPLEDPMEALARLTPSDDEDAEGETESVQVEQSAVVGPEHVSTAQADDLDALSALVGQERAPRRSRVPPPPRSSAPRGAAPPSRRPPSPSQAPGDRSVPPPPPKRN